MKLLTVVGARPQFVKAATVSRQVAASASMHEVIVHTGQHYDRNMSDVFFDELEIPSPTYNLGIGSASHGAQTGRMLEALESVIVKEQPDWVLVYGDTNSTLAGALAASKLHVPVAHVEAGLRSFNRRMPEEINRVLTDHVSDLLFTPTAASDANLLAEGIERGKIDRVGDVMYDAAVFFRERANERSQVRQQLGLEAGAYLLATIHRAENTDDSNRLRAIIGALIDVSRELPVILPVHPRTRRLIEQPLIDTAGNLRLIDPVSYMDMVMLESGARLIATDSGGVQKEAFFFGVPCVTLREETEWVELIECGWNRLLPPSDRGSIAAGIAASIRAGAPTSQPDALYGDGHAAAAIVRRLVG